MKRLTPLLFGICLAFAGSAWAGPNEGGTLIVHGDPGVVYTNEITDYTGFSTLPGGCESAETNYQGESIFVWWVKAAFATDASPRLTGATFGIDYDESNLVLMDFGPSGDFELADPTWPAPQSGTAVTFGSAQTTSLVDLYWFAGYNYAAYGDANFELIAHPTQGAVFADDSVPSILDPVAALGALGWGANSGFLPCPTSGPVTGACCLRDGSCVLLTSAQCAQESGEYMGDGVSCDPTPCEGAYGACCFPDGTCELEREFLCGGEWQPADSCDPNPCQIVPTEERSWGEIKNTYRR
ncbi:MAG: hypothetical protein R3E97_20380 [Candidatus Eisenbacteria bacterium]